MKRIQLFLLLTLISWSVSAQTTPWTGSPAITFQTRTFNGAKELRAIQSPSFVFAIMDSLRTRTYTFGNGLTNDGSGNVRLGGDLIDYTPINLNGNAFQITGFDDSGNGNDFTMFGQQVRIQGFRGFRSSTINVESENLKLYHTNKDPILGTIGMTFLLDSIKGAQFIDDEYNRGIIYSHVNRNNFTDTSLVDKGYVDSIATSITINPDSVLHPLKNLNDVSNKATARSNLGVVAIDTLNISDYGFNTANRLFVNPSNSMLSFGTSYWYLGNSQIYKAAPILVQQALNIGTYTRLASSGDDIQYAIARAIASEAVTNSSSTVLIDVGYNNLAHSPTTVKAISTSTIGINSFIANHFLATALPASNVGISYTSGTWANAPADSLGGKAVSLSGTAKQTTSSGASFTYTSTGPNLVVQTFGGDGVNLITDSFTITVDGILQGSYNFNGSCYYLLRSGDPGHNLLKWYSLPAAVVLNNLGSGSHTVVVTKGTNTASKLILDYVGTLNIPINCAPLIVAGSPHFTQQRLSVNHSTYGNNFTNITVDSLNNLIRKVVKSNWQSYPISYVNPPSWVTTNADDMIADSTHLSDLGHQKWAQMVLSQLQPIKIQSTNTGGTNITSYAQGDIIYASGTNTLSTLPKNTNAIRYLSNAGTNNAPVWNIVNLTNGVGGVLPYSNGGTSQATYSAGDMLYASAINTLSKLAIGSTNQVLTIIGGVPTWQNSTSGFTNPMTSLGDIIYGGASGAATRLAGNTATSRRFLTSTGNGTISAAPTYFDLFNTANTWGPFQSLSNGVGIGTSGGSASAIGYNMPDGHTVTIYPQNAASTNTVLIMPSSTLASDTIALKSYVKSPITGTPTIAAGAGAGTSPTVSVTTNGKGLQVTVTTGTLPTGTNAVVATVTLANSLPYTPYPVFSSANGATSLLNGASMIYMASTGATNVTITSGTTALVAATTYTWNISL